MNRLLPALALLAACWGQSAYILEGTVVAVDGSTVTVDHDEIDGFMAPMTMPFEIRDDVQVSPGDRIVARLMVEEQGSYLAKVRITGHTAPPAQVEGVAPIKSGEPLPATTVELAQGGSLTLGEGQQGSVALTFAYTTCPMPEFCPAVVSRLQGLQPRLPEDARIVVVTLDPEGDTPAVLQAFATDVGATARWNWARMEPAALQDLAMRSGLSVREEDGQILHSLRMLVLDDQGTLVERYDDTHWPLDRVVEQLATGRPAAPEGTSGTLTPK
ncbi:MAG: SCO family protein [Proteobacteria bacterium]|nr:SCO family protein [Pseudomonadota bacterium]